MKRRLVLVLALTLGAIALSLMLVPAALAKSGCAAAGSSGKTGIVVFGVCYSPHARLGGGRHGVAAPQTKTVQCTHSCKPCFATGLGTAALTFPFQTYTKVNGRWSNPVGWCAGDAQPVATLAAIAEQVRRLLPHVSIGAAWTTTTLVNAQTILWAATSSDRDLGTVAVVGIPVHLRISFDHGDWNFGDGKTDRITEPGKPYDRVGDACHTAQCPHYFGHTYEHTGRMTITLAVTWRAQFSLDGVDWTDIPDPITGPNYGHAIRVLQARGVLIPNPGGR